MEAYDSFAQQLFWGPSGRFVDLEAHCNLDAILSDSPSAIHRYLREQEPRPLFTTSFIADREADMLVQTFPSAVNNMMKYPTPGLASSFHFHRQISPAHTGLSSSHTNSDWSDLHDTPLSSPTPNADLWAPECRYVLEAIRPDLGGDRNGEQTSLQGVAMQDVQKHADELGERFETEEDSLLYDSSYTAFAVSEGYQPMLDSSDETIDPISNIYSSQHTVQEATKQGETNLLINRRRRTQSSKSTTSPDPSAKITKRPSPNKRTCSSGGSSMHGRSGPKSTSTSVDAFPCPLIVYGCRSTFHSKNEWKRHVNTQHMRFGFWRCDQCPNVEQKPNDFNRKDLFTQHVRRMHPIEERHPSASPKKGGYKPTTREVPEEQVLAAASKRCYQSTRVQPEHSCCLLCDKVFHGPVSWDERMEHIGRHMERSKKDNKALAPPQEWRTDADLEAWMIDENILVPYEARLVLAEGRQE